MGRICSESAAPIRRLDVVSQQQLAVSASPAVSECYHGTAESVLGTNRRSSYGALVAGMAFLRLANLRDSGVGVQHTQRIRSMKPAARDGDEEPR